MSTSVLLGIQPLGATFSNLDFEFDTTSRSASMYNGDQWAFSQASRGAYMEFPVPNAQPSERHYSLQPIFSQATSNDSRSHNEPPPRYYHDFGRHSSRIGTLGMATGLQSSSAIFTASNARLHPYDAATSSPLDTQSLDPRFGVDHASPCSDAKMSFDRQMDHTASSSFAIIANDTDASTQARCDSLQSRFGSISPTIIPHPQVGRRRGSEYAEPGSARATYLEKNRKAASKCRTKQKRQQEELVETAREVERQNKILKAEVEILKSGMRDLMELVAQHSDCPDARLKLYVQREADRLATAGMRNHVSLPMSNPGPNLNGKASARGND